jgi:hypothetical protein
MGYSSYKGVRAGPDKIIQHVHELSAAPSVWDNFVHLRDAEQARALVEWRDREDEESARLYFEAGARANPSHLPVWQAWGCMEADLVSLLCLYCCLVVHGCSRCEVAPPTDSTGAGDLCTCASLVVVELHRV